MAILTSDDGNLSLTIEHSYIYQTPMGWLEFGYRCKFMWQGQSLFSHHIHTDSDGFISGEDEDTPRIIDILKAALDNDVYSEWNNIAYPSFSISINKPHDESSPAQRFIIVTVLDTVNFKGAKTYDADNGLALQLSVNRKKLAIFVNDLEKEVASLMLEHEHPDPIS